MKVNQFDRLKAMSGRCGTFSDDLDYIPTFETRNIKIRIKEVKEHTPKIVL